MTTQKNKPDDKEPDNSEVMAFLAFFLGSGAGFGLLLFSEMIWPSLSERWSVEPSFIGMLCAAGVLSAVGLFISSRQIRHARIVAFCSFVGLFMPWLLHLMLKILEIARGAGI